MNGQRIGRSRRLTGAPHRGGIPIGSMMTSPCGGWQRRPVQSVMVSPAPAKTGPDVSLLNPSWSLRAPKLRLMSTKPTRRLPIHPLAWMCWRAIFAIAAARNRARRGATAAERQCSGPTFG